MSRAATRPANPAPATNSTNRDPDTRGISPRPYSFIRPMPVLPERWRSPQDQDKLLSEYLSHDGYLATFASSRGLTIDQLYDWLHSEPIMARRKRLSDMAQERADLLACLARPAAIDTLLRMVTQGSLNHNQTRLAASAILRAAAAADRRAVKNSRAEEASPSPSSSAGGGGEALRAGGGSASTSSTNAPSHRTAPAAPPRSPTSVSKVPHRTEIATRPSASNPSRILARIGPPARNGHTAAPKPSKRLPSGDFP